MFAGRTVSARVGTFAPQCSFRSRLLYRSNPLLQLLTRNLSLVLDSRYKSEHFEKSPTLWMEVASIAIRPVVSIACMRIRNLSPIAHHAEFPTAIWVRDLAAPGLWDLTSE